MMFVSRECEDVIDIWDSKPIYINDAFGDFFYGAKASHSMSTTFGKTIGINIEIGQVKEYNIVEVK